MSHPKPTPNWPGHPSKKPPGVAAPANPTEWGVLSMPETAFAYGRRTYKFVSYYGLAAPGYHVARVSPSGAKGDTTFTVCILRENRANQSFDVVYLTDLSTLVDLSLLGRDLLNLDNILQYVDPITNGVEFTFGYLNQADELNTLALLRIQWNSTFSSFTARAASLLYNNRRGDAAVPAFANLLKVDADGLTATRTIMPEYSYNNWYYGKLGNSSDVYYVLQKPDGNYALGTWNWAANRYTVINADLNATWSDDPQVDLSKVFGDCAFIGHPQGLVCTFLAPDSEDGAIRNGWLWDMKLGAAIMVTANDEECAKTKKFCVKTRYTPSNNRYVSLVSIYDASEGKIREGDTGVYTAEAFFYEVGKGIKGCTMDSAVFISSADTLDWWWWAGEDYFFITNPADGVSLYVDTATPAFKLANSGVCTNNFSDALRESSSTTLYSQLFRIDDQPLSITYTVYPRL